MVNMNNIAHAKILSAFRGQY